MAAKKRVNITVQVTESHLNNADEVTKSLKKKGFQLKETLREIGVLTGSAPADAISSLSSVEGVAAIEQERSDYHTQS